MTDSITRVTVLVLLAMLVVGAGPGVAATQSVSDSDGIGATVVVEEDETVDDVSAIAGNVYVDGTVEGDVSTVAGNVFVDGDVEGDVSGVAGNLEISGTVEGDVSAAAGNVNLLEDGSVGGDVSAAAGNVVLEGTIDGDAALAAGTIQLEETAAIDGDLEYSGDLQGETGVVAGELTQTTLEFGFEPVLEPFVSWLAALYAFALNLLLGAALLLLFPRFSDGVADRVANAPVRAGLVGVGVLFAVPVLLIAVAITIIGIPLSVIGGFLFAFSVWVGIVYGRFAVAAWILSALEVENRWLALVVGLLGGAVLGQVPFVGGLVNFLIFLLGFGAFSMALYGHGRRRRRSSPTSAGPDDPAVD